MANFTEEELNKILNLPEFQRIQSNTLVLHQTCHEPSATEFRHCNLCLSVFAFALTQESPRIREIFSKKSETLKSICLTVEKFNATS